MSLLNRSVVSEFQLAQIIALIFFCLRSTLSIKKLNPAANIILQYSNMVEWVHDITLEAFVLIGYDEFYKVFLYFCLSY